MPGGACTRLLRYRCPAHCRFTDTYPEVPFSRPRRSMSHATLRGGGLAPNQKVGRLDDNVLSTHGHVWQDCSDAQVGLM